MARQNLYSDDRVWFEDDDGAVRSVCAGWTSLAEPDPLVVVAAGRSSLRADDLLRLADLIASLRRGRAGGAS